MEPPRISRITYKENATRRRINNNNKNGPPSKNWRNYTPGLNETVILMNTSTGYNYKKNAKAKMAASWNNYMKKHAINTRKNNKNKNKNKNNNTTRKVLF